MEKSEHLNRHTDDEHDAFWLAHLMRLGILPTGYIYPKAERGFRDLARQRMRLVQHRSSHITSVQMRQLPAPANEDTAVARIQSRVDAAAFTLLREGKNPTVALVRARMGGGSHNIVAPALQKWRFTLAAQLHANAGSALEVLPPGVLELVQALWSRALFEAHRVRADAPSSLRRPAKRGPQSRARRKAKAL